MEVAADGQVVQVVAGPAGTGAALAVAGGGAVDDPRIPGSDGFVADAQSVYYPRSEALDDDVGRGGQAQEGLPTAVRLEIEEHPAHPPMGAVGVGGRHYLHPGVPGDGPDLDHVGSPVGQPPRGPYSGSYRGEVQDGHTVEKGAVDHGPGLEVLREAEAPPGDDVLQDLRGAPSDGVQHGEAVGGLGPPDHGGVDGADP